MSRKPLEEGQSGQPTDSRVALSTRPDVVYRDHSSATPGGALPATREAVHAPPGKGGDEPGPMTCARCGGRMRNELILELFENDGQVSMGWWSGYRCCACGKLPQPGQDVESPSLSFDRRRGTHCLFPEAHLLTPNKLMSWHRLSRERHTAKEQRECPVCRCEIGVLSWEMLVPWFESHGARDVRFKAPCFEIHNNDVLNRLYRLMAGEGPWV